MQTRSATSSTSTKTTSRPSRRRTSWAAPAASRQVVPASARTGLARQRGTARLVEVELGYGDALVRVDRRFRLDSRRLPGRLEHHALDCGQARAHIGKL